MKTKMYKICGVALALVLVFSLAAAFVPANRAEAQAPGTTPNRWQAVDIPGTPTEKLRASDVADIAVAGDGRTIYAVDNQTAAPGAILKSDTNGMRFSVLPNPLVGQSPQFIAVSPDDPNAIAMVDDTGAGATIAGGVVWISNNGGTTWAALNRVPIVGAAAVITDIAVGPARAGTILQRDYVVSVADPTPNATVDGDVLFMGLTTTWISCTVPVATGTAILDAGDGAGGAADNIANDFDFTSVAISPGFLGDRTIAAVGSDSAVAGLPDDTYLFIIETRDTAPLATVVAPPGAIALNTAATNSPGDYDGPVGGVVPGKIVASSIALPADFDPTIPGGMRTFVGYTSGGLAAVDFDDVYRVDFQTVRKLETGTANGIFSIAYSGTIAGGLLIAGENVLTAPTLTTLVHHTEDPNVSQPSWQTSAKSPTGTANCIVAIDAADPTLAYAGTSGVESAFSWSTNGAVSFNQRSLINTSIDLLHDVMVSPDGSTVFMATADDTTDSTVTGTDPTCVGLLGTATSDMESLWMSSVPTTADSWERVRISPADWGDMIGDSIIRLSPEWDTVPALYWADGPGPFTAVAPPPFYVGTLGTGLQRSVDGGGVFSTRTAPGNIADLTVENNNILYMSDATAVTNVYKSTNGAWFFGLPVDSGFPVYDIEMAPTYPEKPVAGNLVAGTMIGNVIYSPSAGDFWIPLLPLIGGGGNIQVVADVDYANNNTVYAASSTAGQGIWRWQIGTSTTFENIRPIGATQTMTGLAMHGGVLYGSWADPLVAPLVVAADAFTITATAIDAASTITVLAGSVLATSTSAGVTLGGIAVPFSFQILPGAGAVPIGFPAAGGVITFTATTANTTGVWAQVAVTTIAAITANLDGDEGVAAAGGVFTLTDAAAALVPGVAASGTERTLVPTIPVIANWLFDIMDVGAAAANLDSPPNALRIAGTATEVNLWAIDTIAGALMAYDDTMALAKPELTVPETVAFDPVQGRNTQFSISWGAMSNATNFEVEIYSDPACTQLVLASPNRGATAAPWYIPPTPLSPAWVVAANQLVAGTDYFVRARVRDQMPLDAIRSPYSSVYRFSVAGGERVEVSYLGPQPLGPTAGSIDVPLSPGFTWSPYASATRYEFQLATDAGFAAIVAETKTSATGYKYDGKLSNAATYFWRVRGIEPTVTDWSPVASFTTEKAPPPPPPTPPPPPPPPPPVVTPAIIWAIIGIGAILVIAVIVLIVRAGQKT